MPGDLRMIKLGLTLGARVFSGFDYLWLYDEIKKNLPNEMDFRKEAANCKRCGEMFKDNPRVHVPKVFDNFSKERLLVMSFEKGMSVTKVKEMHKQGIDLSKVASLISESFVHMIFKVGFIHGDPHPGNVFVRPSADGNDIELVLLDHGVYTEMDTETRLNYTKLWRGILS